MTVEALGKSNTTRAALASLRIALRSYFETYLVARKYIDFNQLNKSNNVIEYEDYIGQEKYLCNALSYQEKYEQTIFHFHHFFELFMKDVLRLIHPMLALRLNTNDAKTLKNLIEGKSTETLNNQTVEFDASLKRITSLESEIDTPAICKVISRHKKTLEVLNTLRNRAWHRGTYVLRYTELDQFVGSLLLPLVLESLTISQYNELQRYWKYQVTISEDPITRIIQATTSKKTIDYCEIAFFKAIGLASYNVERLPRQVFRYKREAEVKAAALETYTGDIHSIRKCFVCGQNSLVLYQETDCDEDEYKNVYSLWWYIWMAECQGCGLKLHNELNDPKSYGLDEPDIWLSEVRNLPEDK